MDEKRIGFRVGINVFVICNDMLLLGKRKDIAGDGSWGLPGGHLEDHENMEDAARRELDEETGLRADSFVFANLVNQSRGEIHYIQVGFVAENVTGEPELKEPDRCSEWKWFSFDRLPENIFVAHVEQIQAFREKRNFITQ